jgi:hypothetical protein
MKEHCIIEYILWGNTDNKYKPKFIYEFNSYEKALKFINELKDYMYSYMHKININHTIENL